MLSLRKESLYGATTFASLVTSYLGERSTPLHQLLREVWNRACLADPDHGWLDALLHPKELPLDDKKIRPLVRMMSSPLEQTFLADLKEVLRARGRFFLFTLNRREVGGSCIRKAQVDHVPCFEVALSSEEHNLVLVAGKKNRWYFQEFTIDFILPHELLHIYRMVKYSEHSSRLSQQRCPRWSNKEEEETINGSFFENYCETSLLQARGHSFRRLTHHAFTELGNDATETAVKALEEGADGSMHMLCDRHLQSPSTSMYRFSTAPPALKKYAIAFIQIALSDYAFHCETRSHKQLTLDHLTATLYRENPTTAWILLQNILAHCQATPFSFDYIASGGLTWVEKAITHVTTLASSLKLKITPPSKLPIDFTTFPKHV